MSQNSSLRTPEAFAERLRRAIAMRGITQNELSRRLEVSQANVSAWTNGTNMPSGPIMLKLPHVLNVSADWLIDEIGDQTRTDGERPADVERYLAGMEATVATLERMVAEVFARMRADIQALRDKA